MVKFQQIKEVYTYDAPGLPNNEYMREIYNIVKDKVYIINKNIKRV